MYSHNATAVSPQRHNVPVTTTFDQDLVMTHGLSFFFFFCAGPGPHSRGCRRIRSFWGRKRRRRRANSSGRRVQGRCGYGRMCGRSRQRLHRRPVPVLLQPGSAAGRTLGGVPTVPTQPTAVPLPTTHLLSPPGVLRLPAPVSAHRDIGEPGGYRMPAVPRNAGTAGCSCHPG